MACALEASKTRIWSQPAAGSRRDLWVGWKPNGIGRAEAEPLRATIAKTIWENRRNLPYAWRILRKGVCDGCALGVAGFHDWTITGVHLCTTRLDLLQVNTAAAIDPTRARRRRARSRARNGARAARARPARRTRWCAARASRASPACRGTRRST